ncbi:hypothetical protein SS50377_24921 [Spironucleus salmonicida]|uniref:SNF7 family protein n=1 Tax=Spironucleus salmonicida TaxID=348837 RepID=V6LG14_9EUKA|nr:hypothetical protein SS50377_24921 [Spironucleus salmonicida]|eukprot:EST43452.1 hypothetical protein SS50377_ja023 [Spironucleus salmonicida]
MNYLRKLFSRSNTVSPPQVNNDSDMVILNLKLHIERLEQRVVMLQGSISALRSDARNALLQANESGAKAILQRRKILQNEETFLGGQIGACQRQLMAMRGYQTAGASAALLRAVELDYDIVQQSQDALKVAAQNQFVLEKCAEAFGEIGGLGVITDLDAEMDILAQEMRAEQVDDSDGQREYQPAIVESVCVQKTLQAGDVEVEEASCVEIVF